VWEIKTLGRADDERARDMLEKTAWQVQPIMRKRGWKVQELCEMKPEQRDRVGDNLNMGQRVRLKLRKNNSGDWFDYDHVVLVMLHELCHNDIGPHNAKFFKLLDEITVECEELMAKGIGGSGAGFDAKGQRLGHRGGWGGIETRDPRKAAAEAAARRAGYQAAMGPAGGRKLGGGGAGAATQLGPREAAAAAAERRLRAERFARENGLMNDVVVIDDEDDDKFGGDGDEDGAREGGTAKTAPAVSTSLRCPCCDAFRCERDEGFEVVVLSSPGVVTRDAGKRKRASGRRAADEDDEEEAEEAEKEEEKEETDDDDVVFVEAVPAPRPGGDRPERRWTCSQCTLVNPERATHCGACERWRFGRGAPAASRPTVGVDD